MSAQPDLVLCVYRVSRKHVAPLSPFPRNCIKQIDHLVVGGMLALCFVIAILIVAKTATAVVDIMLHGNRSGGTGRLLKNFLNFPVSGSYLSCLLRGCTVLYSCDRETSNPWREGAVF